MSYKVIIGIPLICILVIFFIVMYPIISYSINNLVEYGQLRNPCVNVESFQKAGRDITELFYNDKFECYSHIYGD